MQLLKDNTLFWSRLGFYKDPVPGDGKCPEIFSDTDKQRVYHKQMLDAGVKLHTSVLFSGWVGVDKYDYYLTDKMLEAVMSVDDNILYMPRIKLNVPVSWCAEYPEEVFVYENGPQTPEEIKSMVGTNRHDMTGIMPNTGDPKPQMSNYCRNKGNIGLQSFASRKWLSDAGEALRRLIMHLENGPYADRIIGYHLAYGLCGETVLWGRPSDKVGDYGICVKKEFFRWGLSEYGSLQKLRAAWGQNELSENNLMIPTKAEREGTTESYVEFFRMTEKDRICIDYDRFMSAVNVNAMEHFAKIAKQFSSNKPVGYFYGYILGVINPSYTGHLEIDRVLDSQYIDFLSAPKAYYKKIVGESGGTMIPVQSICRKKLCIEELDNQTHLIDYAYSLCKDFNDSRSVMWREACKNTSYGSNFWWMDLYEGAFNSKELLDEAAKIEVFKRTVSAGPAESVSEILLVVDERMFYHSRRSAELQYLCWEQLRQIGRCGTPVDIYRFSDLKALELSRYRALVFLMPYCMTPTECTDICRRLSKDAVIIWTGVPGVANGIDVPSEICGLSFRSSDIDFFSGLHQDPARDSGIEGIMDAFDCLSLDKEFTGSLKKRCGIEFGHLPMFEIIYGDAVRVVSTYKNGSVAGAKCSFNDHENICFTVAPLKSKHWRSIFESAGVFMYAPLGTTVYANSRFISVFNNEKLTGTLSLPDKRSFMCIQAGEHFHDLSETAVKMEEHEARVFVYKDPVSHAQ